MEYRRTIERTFDVRDQPDLVIANRNGRLTVRGEDRDDIAFTATLRVRAGSEDEANDLFDSVDLPISDVDGSIEIGPPRIEDDIEESGFWSWFQGWRRRVRIDMLAVVPRNCAVDAENRSGSTSVEGIHAPVNVEGRAGRIAVQNIEGDLSVTSEAGSIGIESVEGRVSATASAGSIAVERVTGRLAVETRAGSIKARSIDGDVEATARSGSVELEEVQGAVRVDGRSGGVRYRGPVVDAVEISVRSGGITLGVPRDSSFFLDAESNKGSVTSELDVDSTQEPSAEAPTVRLRTEMGSIKLVPA